MLAPLLSEEDRETSLEGALDPLGLYAIADSLAVRLVPGVRERQSRIRFLTAMAVSAAVCAGHDPDEVATDRTSPPWLVFEWYTVEGLIRSAGLDTELTGIPGSDKARQAIHDRVPLSANRYLKAPTIFGFHAVYRQLARSLDIEDDGVLGDTGVELLDAWASEQGLDGFCGTGTGPGRAWRERLARAVSDGLAAGAVARKPGWSGWQFFATHLAPAEIGAREALVILRGLEQETEPLRRQVFQGLVSPEGSKVWLETSSERAFHQFLHAQSRGELRDLLEAILNFETWSRLLADAFGDCLHRMTLTRAKTTIEELAQMPLVQKAWKQIPPLYPRIAEQLEAFGETGRFVQSFEELGDSVSLHEWVARFTEHHRRNQRRKPPNGKNPWYERFDDGSLMIRPDYLQKQGGRGDDVYLHGYRTWPLYSFARDLRVMA